MRGWNKIYEYDIYLSRYKKHGLHLEKNTESWNECNYLTVSNSQIVSENYSDILLVSLFAVATFLPASSDVSPEFQNRDVSYPK